MKKILFILSLSLVCVTTYVHAESEDFGKVGVDRILVSPISPTSIKINAAFFNLSSADIPVHVEASVTDTYSKAQYKNINLITSDTIDRDLVIPKRVNSFEKEYTYNIPEIPKKDSYKIELRVVDTHENILYERQSEVVTLGNTLVSNLSKIETTSWFQYDGKKYGLQDGPIVDVSKKDSAFYAVEVNNTSTSSVKVYVDYSTRKYALETSEFVKNADASVTVEIPKKSKKIIQIPAKYIQEGGTYEGKIDISMHDGDTVVALKTEEFRYMIGGSFVVVTDAQLGTSSVSLSISKTLFDSTIELTQAYLDSTSSNQVIGEYVDKQYTFDIDFLNDAGSVIGTQTTQVNWGNINPTLQVPITAASLEPKDVSQIRVTVKDFNNAELYTGTFDVMPTTIAKGFASLTQKSIALITLFILVILAAIGYGVNRHKLWLVCLLICAALLAYVSYTRVSAFPGISSGNFTMSAFTDGGIDAGSHPLCWNHGYRGLTMQAVSFPSPSDTFTCGQTVQVRLDPTNSTCGNTPSTTYFYVSGFNGLTVSNGAGGTVPVGGSAMVYYRGIGAFPLTVTFNNGFTGNATLTGHYYNINGACASTAGDVTLTFKNVTCSQSCTCNGRDSVCKNGAVTSTTTNAAACQLGVACGTSVSGTNGTFTYTVSNKVGNLTYTDTDSGAAITNPYTKNVAVGQTITQKTTITDLFDNSKAYSVCSITNNGNGGGSSNGGSSSASTTAPRSPRVVTFKSSSPVVNRGTNCTYTWDTQDVDRCTMVVNSHSISLIAPGTSGPVSVPTDDGLNQQATITCTADAVGTSSPAIQVSTTTLCQVLPEVIEH